MNKSNDAANEALQVAFQSAVFYDLRVPSRKGQEIGLLQLEVLQAFGLPKLDQFGETDAYCFAVCGAYAFRTDVIPDVSNPSWLPHMRRACIFPLFEAYARLYVGIFDDDGEGDRDDFAGRVVLDMARMRPNSMYDVTLPLRQSAHVYSKRPRGAIRLRFKVQYYSERRMVLSYLPTKAPKVSEPDTSVTVRCCDRKAFQNVALTVHGTHMPGRFSMKMVKALIREVTFTQVHILRYMRKREMQSLFSWEYPIISGFCFVAWMHGVYRNTLGYVPGHIVAFLLLHLWKNYAHYAADAPLHHGFIPPTWEELFAALLYGQRTQEKQQIAPLKIAALPRRSPLEFVHGPMASLDLDDRTLRERCKNMKNLGTSDLYAIAGSFSRGVETRKRRGRSTFTGADAVRFLMTAGYAESREQALVLGRKLQHQIHLFGPASGQENNLHDDPNHRYCFLQHERPHFLSKTHQPWGKFFFRMIGFAPANPSFEKDQMNFPFGGGTSQPRITVQDSLCLRAKETKKRHRLLKSLSISSSDESVDSSGQKIMISKELILSDDDSVGTPSTKSMESTNGTSVVSAGSSDSDCCNATPSTFSMRNNNCCEGKSSIKLKPPSEQDIDFKTTADKPIGEVLENVRDLVHKHMLHAFNVKTYVIKNIPGDGAISARPKRRGLGRLRAAVGQTVRRKNKRSQSDENMALPVDSGHSQYSFHDESGHVPLSSSGLVTDGEGDSEEDVGMPLSAASTANTKEEHDKLLKTGASSNSNPWVSKIGVLVQPMVESALGVLGMIRSIYNIFTWRDPLLSFWISLVGPLIVIVLYVCPWRLIFGIVGLVFLGPQNWILRILRERNGVAPPDPDLVIKPSKPKLAPEPVQEEGPLFSCKANQTSPIEHSTVRDKDIRHVVVPHTPLLFSHRFYDWPPEPQFCEVSPDCSPIGSNIVSGTAAVVLKESHPATRSDAGSVTHVNKTKKKKWYQRSRKDD